jgi:proteasome lid subunit RPN8/RPN11
VESWQHRFADRWVPLENVAEFPRVRYEVDPEEVLAAHEALEADGRYPWIVVHSHPGPRGTTAPSGPDVAYARNPKQLHLIVADGGLHTVMVLWRLTPGADEPDRVVRVRWQVVDQAQHESWTTDLTHGVTGG